VALEVIDGVLPVVDDDEGVADAKRKRMANSKA
jgi:hypothetical protein